MKIKYGEPSDEYEDGSLENTVLFLKQKADELVSLEKITPDERRVIEVNFNNLFNIETDGKIQAFCLLKLAIRALEDREVAWQMCNENSLEDIIEEKLANDISDRWSGWFKSAIVDSQLAYRRDRGDMSIPNNEELNRDTSCFGGSLNRIIFALNLIHPDVKVLEGQGTLANIGLYQQVIAKINVFGQNSLQEIANQYLIAKLANFSLEDLEKILKELENSDETIGSESNSKSEILISLEHDLETHIIDNARTTLEIQDVGLIERQLAPFISTYISDLLQDKIEETIQEKVAVSASSSSSQVAYKHSI